MLALFGPKLSQAKGGRDGRPTLSVDKAEQVGVGLLVKWTVGE